MRNALVVAFVSMMVIGLAAGVSAYSGVVLNLQPISDAGSFHTVQIGYMISTAVSGPGNPTTDGVDVGWDMQDTLTPPAGTIEMDIVNPVIAASKVQYDFRAPLHNKIWRLKTTVANPDANGEMVGASFGLSAWFQTGFGPGQEAFYIFNANYTTQAQCWAAIGGPTQIARLMGPTTSFSNASNTYSLAAPVYDAENDSWSTPSKYFTIFVGTPEPSSLLAMFSGLAGLVAVGIRRRK